jgi:DNA-binding HxlR family transcriptional regulator
MGAKGCPIERAVTVLDGKWTLLILRELLTGTKRFGELRAELDGISPKTLSDRLKTMEEQGIVTRKVFAEVPLHVEYSLSEFGETLRPVIDVLRQWGEEWGQQVHD